MKEKYLKNNFVLKYPLKNIKLKKSSEKKHYITNIQDQFSKQDKERPIIISIDGLLLDGYKKYYLTKKKKKKTILAMVYPYKLNSEEKKMFFQFKEKIFHEKLPFYKKVKFFVLLYPEAVYKTNLFSMQSLMQVYEEINEKIHLSNRQQQRIKAIHKKSLERAIKKKRKCIKDKDISKIIDEQNQKRRIFYNQNKIKHNDSK